MDFIPTSVIRNARGIMLSRKTIDLTTRKVGEKKLWISATDDADLYAAAVQLADEIESEGEA
jgi:hypothetical protein